MPNAPDELPDDADLTETFPIVFFGLGGYRDAYETPMFGGGGTKMNICGRDEAFQAHLSVAGEAGIWFVRKVR